MTTRRQAAANRQNALRSTGPRTEKGKDAAKWNAMRHGLRAETLVLPDEDPVEFDGFRQAIIDELAPTGELEAVLVDRIATLAWRLRRVGRIEAGIFIRQQGRELARRARHKAERYLDHAMDAFDMMKVQDADREAYDQALQEAEKAEGQADAFDLPFATAFDGHSNMLANVSRYETTLERGLFKALHELERLQARRAGQPVLPPAVVDVNLDVQQDSPMTPQGGRED